MYIDNNDNVYISAKRVAPRTFKECKECGCELFGGEISGEDANGYCDSCNI